MNYISKNEKDKVSRALHEYRNNETIKTILKMKRSQNYIHIRNEEKFMNEEDLIKESYILTKN